MRLRGRVRDERVVGTSTPGEWCKPGTLYQWREGHPWYRITRVKQVGPTRLMDGGLMPHFEVMGVPVPTPPPEDRGSIFRSVLSLGDLAPGESRRVALDNNGWRTIVRSDPNPMPRFTLRGHTIGAARQVES